MPSRSQFCKVCGQKLDWEDQESKLSCQNVECDLFDTRIIGNCGKAEYVGVGEQI